MSVPQNRITDKPTSPIAFPSSHSHGFPVGEDAASKRLKAEPETLHEEEEEVSLEEEEVPLQFKFQMHGVLIGVSRQAFLPDLHCVCHLRTQREREREREKKQQSKQPLQDPVQVKTEAET